MFSTELKCFFDQTGIFDDEEDNEDEYFDDIDDDDDW